MRLDAFSGGKHDREMPKGGECPLGSRSDGEKKGMGKTSMRWVQRAAGGGSELNTGAIPV